jgi:hypothetical protein
MNCVENHDTYVRTRLSIYYLTVRKFPFLNTTVTLSWSLIWYFKQYCHFELESYLALQRVLSLRAGVLFGTSNSTVTLSWSLIWYFKEYCHFELESYLALQRVLSL